MTPLEVLLQDPGFTPGRRHLVPLLDLLASPDETLASLVERALLRGPPISSLILGQLPSARPPARGRLVRLLGRIPSSPEEPVLLTLIALLEDPDLPTSRQAALALGRLPGTASEQALLSRFRPHTPLPLLRAITEALGKIGSRQALDFIQQYHSEDRELTRLLQRASVMLTRSTRPESQPFDPRIAAPGRFPIVLRCKRGLEEILLQEASRIVQNLHIQSPGLLRGTFQGPLVRLASLRVALSFGFSLPSIASPPGKQASSLLTVLQQEPAQTLFSTWGERPARFRIAWRDGGHHRSLVWEMAHLSLNSGGALLNDPNDAPWEVLVWEHHGLLHSELIPKNLPDLRFAYREEDVPAASHPTVAAALALVGGVQEDDIIWDPFCGSGLELCERAWLGPYAVIHGSDHSPEAIEIARRNLTNARVSSTLTVADAREHRIPGLSLVLSNPPLGHRVARHEDLLPLLESVISSVARQLRPQGRMVWLSPFGERTALAGERAGLLVERRGRVDLGGIDTELQVFRRS